MESASLIRRIDLRGCWNFRDLGGYITHQGRELRWRQLFRSDALHLLTEQDVRIVRDELGVGLIVDLRSTAELEIEGRGALGHEQIAFRHQPLFDGQISASGARREHDSLADRYFLLAEHAKARIAGVVTTLASSPTPAVYHCAAGKDRTGVVTAVLLGLLGVPDETIVADYTVTRETLERIVERLASLHGYQEMLSLLPADTLHAEPETMANLLARVQERYGGMEGYARAAGVSATAIDQLRARMIAP